MTEYHSVFFLHTISSTFLIIACEYAAIMMGRSEHSIRQWHTGEILEHKQGRNQRDGFARGHVRIMVAPYNAMHSCSK